LVSGPVTNDTVNEIRDFLDIQRFALPYGDYVLTLTMVDVNSPGDTNSSVINIDVVEPKTTAYFSDIMLVQSYSKTEKKNLFTRGNVDIVPRVSTFYSPSDSALSYYVEFYNADKHLGENEDYLISAQIINPENGTSLDAFQVYKRKTAVSTDIVFNHLNIDNLYTGNYFLIIEARDRNNVAFATKKVLINRYNAINFAEGLKPSIIEQTFVMKINARDSLRKMVYCLRPRVSTSEKEYIDRSWETGDSTELRGFLYGYWQSQNNLDPESAYKAYTTDVSYVLREFRVKNRLGCATDRGRVYLQYGKPSSVISQTSDPVAYPYEIWHYYATPVKANARFLFYDPTRITSNYLLLHSDVPGEKQDYQWQNRLEAPRGMPTTLDETPNTNNVGNRAADYWNLPR
jgi:GWxTD domain-containing protein